MRALASLLLLSATAGCAAHADRPVTLKILAPPSLTEALPDLTEVYHQANPEVRFRLDYGGSQELVTELDGADVVAAEDEQTLEGVRDEIGVPYVVAADSLTIAVAPGNPLKLTGVRPLERKKLRIVLGDLDGPLGRYSRAVFENAGITVQPAEEETDARAVLSLVRSGRADAGLVYVTDMKSAGAAASSVAIPARFNVKARYAVAPINASHHDAQARAFVSWLAGSQAQGLLRKYGFQAP